MLRSSGRSESDSSLYITICPEKAVVKDLFKYQRRSIFKAGEGGHRSAMGFHRRPPTGLTLSDSVSFVQDACAWNQLVRARTTSEFKEL